MLWVDYLIIGLVAASALIGLFRGFLREVISLVVWVLAFAAAYFFGRTAAEYLTPYIETPSIRLAAAYVGLFVLVLIVGGIINYLIGRLVSNSGLAGTDRAIGMVFGIVRGAALAILLVLLAALTPAPQDPWWKESASIRLLEPYAMWARSLLPEDMRKEFLFSGEQPASESPEPIPAPAPPAPSSTAPAPAVPEKAPAPSPAPPTGG